MKIRSGFVSNSSTSSFVILGHKIKETDKNLNKIIKCLTDKDIKYKLEEDEDGFAETLYGLDDEFVYKNEEETGDGAIIGVEIIHASSDGCWDMTVEELNKNISKATEKLKKLDFKTKPKLFYGVNIDYQGEIK